MSDQSKIQNRKSKIVPVIVKSQRDPRTLKPHPLNLLIYGPAKPDKDYVESVRANGTLEPVRIDENGVIISGHWRTAAAIEAGLEAIPVLIYSGYDPVDLEKLLLELNRRRPKTNEQQAREYAELRRIEEVLARKRQQAGVGANSPQGGRAPRASDIAAKQVGMGRKKAEQAAKVVTEIDKAQAAGDTAKADDLRETLNNQSVHAAHEKVVEKELVDALGAAVPERLRAVFESVETFRALRNMATSLKSKLKDLCDLPGGARLRANTLSIDMGNVFQHIGFAMPYGPCVVCNSARNDCGACKGTGWLTESEYETATKAADGKIKP